MLAEKETPPTAEMIATQRHIYSLTGLRFFAALWVVLLHFVTIQHSTKGHPLLHNWLQHGQLGVSMFFVLSGFVLGHNYLEKTAEGKFDLRSFLVARFARVYPVYLLSILIFTPFAIRYTAQSSPEIGMFMALLIQLVLHVVVLQTWFPQLLYLTRWNTPTWSLGVEGFFYGNFPWLARRIAAMSLRTSLLSAACILLFLAGTRFLYWKLDLDGASDRIPNETRDFYAGLLFFNPLLRVPEFALGILGVHLIRSTREWLDRLKDSVYLVGLGVVLASLGLILSFQHTSETRIWTNPTVVFLLFSLICLLSLERIRFVRNVLCSPLLVLLGEASYSMYVLQRPIAEYCNFVSVRLGVETIEKNLAVFLIFLVVLTCVSVAVFKYFEVPSRKRIRSFLTRKTP